MPDEKDTPVDSGEFADNFFEALYSLGGESSPAISEDDTDEVATLTDRIIKLVTVLESSSYGTGADVDIADLDLDTSDQMDEIPDGDCVL